MSKIISTKKISATFLAIVLIAGTIAMISPSFMPNAQAAPYGMDNHNYPSFGKDKFGKNIGVKYVKCNNINVNVNGLELDINDFPPGLLGADAAETQASGLGNGMGGSSDGPSGFDNDGFVYVCINNNNNVVGGEEPDISCEECFTKNLDPEEQTELLTEISEETGGSITTFEQLCQAISNLVASEDEEELQELSDGLAALFISAGLSPEQFDTVLDCLNEVFDGGIPLPNTP